MEFLKVSPEGLAIFQTFTHVPNFKVQADMIMEAASQLDHCATVMKNIGVDIIAQVGTPFSFAHGKGLSLTKTVQERLEQKTGLPCVLQGLSVVNILKSNGFGSVSVACTYYNDDLAQKYTDFIEDAGIKVHSMVNWVTQGIFPTQEHVDLSRGVYRMSQVYDAAKMSANNSPGADCIVISGGGVRTLDLLEVLEQDIGKPVITSDSAMFREIFDRLGVNGPLTGWGSILGQ